MSAVLKAHWLADVTAVTKDERKVDEKVDRTAAEWAEKLVAKWVEKSVVGKDIQKVVEKEQRLDNALVEKKENFEAVCSGEMMENKTVDWLGLVKARMSVDGLDLKLVAWKVLVMAVEKDDQWEFWKADWMADLTEK